tara:strand:+ start:363 stop:614 length:252 start_codon:yes stop_codon:yes gene_type:complete
MEDQVIKILLLSTNEYIISEISEVPAEFGDPNCKLTNPRYTDTMNKWLGEYTNQKEMMIHSDKIITIIDPNEEYLKKYIDATS